MKQYLDLMKDVLENGRPSSDRTGVGTRRVFGRQMRFDLNEGFPLVTTKKIHWPSVAHELLWFIGGDTNVKYLNDNCVNIWNEWANSDGDLGAIYGRQWRDWGGIDQLANVIEQIKTNPQSRRLVVNAWNVGELDDMTLQPCHMMFQFFVSDDSKLSCQMYQRSADVFLGVPFNIASYALLTQMVAEECGLGLGELVWLGGDVHIYDNHVGQCRIQIEREPMKPPVVHLSSDTVFDASFDNIHLIDYESHSVLKGKVAV